MKKILLTLLMLVIASQLCLSQIAVIPLGGNAWVKEPALITDNGLSNWTDARVIPTIHFRVNKPVKLKLSLRMHSTPGNVIGVTIAGKKFTIKASGNDTVTIGQVMINRPGYLKLELQGIQKTGEVYADVSDLIVKGMAQDSDLVYVRKGSSFHFGRRGPSVHLNYVIPGELKNKVAWFYSEITVPVGMDKIGSYFEADGFGEGYFGMQVNSETERRVLFSVWSPFNTQNPKDIPDSMRIKLMKKGTSVKSNDFGDEGSGGQSYLNFNWQTGRTYSFLVSAKPDTAKGNTTYTAYFRDIKAGKWYLVASFTRPKTVKYLDHLYSFLENFIPENGDQTRMAYYTNQWIAGSNANWIQPAQIIYTGDATAKGNFRKDHAGGIINGKLYLKNGGFFNDYKSIGQKIEYKTNNKPPQINLKELPQN